MKCWTAAEVKAFLAATRESREYPLWRLLACAGLRRGEAVGLRWDDVQFIPPADDDEGAELGRLSIRRALVSVGYQVQESEPKTAPAGAPSRWTPPRWRPCASRTAGRRRRGVGRDVDRYRLRLHTRERPADAPRPRHQAL